VGVSVNVIWVTSQGPCGEHAHQCEMFAILSYVVKVVIKSRIFSPVTRQPALPWQLFRDALVGGSSPYSPPSMKLMWPPMMELSHILSVYIMCQYDLFSPKLGHMTRRSWWTYVPIWKFIDVLFSEIWGHKIRFSCHVARQPALPWQPFCASLVGGSSSCYVPSMNFIGPSVTELLQFLIWYVMWRCDLDLWLFDLGVMSRDATCVIILCTKFELDTAYRSGVRTITIFHWPPA